MTKIQNPEMPLPHGQNMDTHDHCECEDCGLLARVERAVKRGASFSDETGWWELLDVEDDGTVWLGNPDGGERETTIYDLPEEITA